jgi:hypothetical protein
LVLPKVAGIRDQDKDQDGGTGARHEKTRGRGKTRQVEKDEEKRYIYGPVCRGTRKKTVKKATQ